MAEETTPAPAPAPQAELPMPTRGGCYLRQSDGSLVPDPDAQPAGEPAAQE
jgi:hypothetical protein